MATAEERLRILKMIRDGRISAEEGAQLLSALTHAAENSSAVPPYNFPNPGGAHGRHVRIRVTDLASGRPHVNIRLPISLVDMALKIGARFGVESDAMRAREVIEAIKSNVAGPIVDVVDERARERVEIVIE